MTVDFRALRTNPRRQAAAADAPSSSRRGTVLGGLRDGVSTFNDEDIHFDYFAEPETVEAAQPGRRLPRLQRSRGPGSGDGPRRPASPPSGRAPLARLAGLIAIVIVIVVALVSWIGACQGTGKQAEYASYLSNVGALAQSSSKLGAEFATTFRSSGLKTSGLERSLQGYAAHEQQAYDQAQQIRVPGPLRQANQQLLDALELRVKGLTGLGEALAQASPFKRASATTLTGVLTAQAQLLTTSDVVWDQLYRAAATEQIKAQRVIGLAVPESHFIANTDLVGARSFGLLLQRLHGLSTLPAPATLLKAGDSGAAVGAWQVQLNRWLPTTQPPQGLLTITRIFDPATEAATKTLQTAASITADGIVGLATRLALRRELAHPG
jgi:peptidoglycan hydrolase-like protein with peptidoglycan-binding domain